MYHLQPPPEPSWLDVLPGVRIRFKPLGSAGKTAGRFAVAQLPEGASAADRSFAYTVGAAQWGAVEWEGVGDDKGKALKLTRQALAAFMEAEDAVFDKIDADYVLPVLLRDREKNGSSPSQTGTSTAAKPTARPARKSARNARRG